MCDCASCGAFVRCDNEGCVNSECPTCRKYREEMEQAAAVPDIDPAEETMGFDGEGRR